MKAFVAVALAAAAQAAPEADPQLLLAQPQVHVYGNAHAQTMGMVQHANGAVVPDDTLSVKAAKVDHLNAKATAYLNKPLVAAQPLVQTVGSIYPAYSGLYHPYALNTHAFIKREAEAEAEADPQLLLNAPVTYSGVHNLAYNGVYNYVKPAVTYTTPVVAKTVVKTPVVAKSVVTPAVYSGMYNYGIPSAYHYLGKREAEADPAFYYGNYGYGYPTYTGYTGYTVPAVAKTVVPAVATKTVVQTPVVAKSVVSPFYSALNYPYTTYGHGLIKREAEAEAEPLYYGNYGYNYPAYTTGYTGYTGYSGLNYAYNPVYGYNNLGYNYLY